MLVMCHHCEIQNQPRRDAEASVKQDLNIPRYKIIVQAWSWPDQPRIRIPSFRA